MRTFLPHALCFSNLPCIIFYYELTTVVLSFRWRKCFKHWKSWLSTMTRSYRKLNWGTKKMRLWMRICSARLWVSWTCSVLRVFLTWLFEFDMQYMAGCHVAVFTVGACIEFSTLRQSFLMFLLFLFDLPLFSSYWRHGGDVLQQTVSETYLLVLFWWWADVSREFVTSDKVWVEADVRDPVLTDRRLVRGVVATCR